MALTGFVAANAAQTESANKSTALGRGVSPFVQDAKFQVTGFGYKLPEQDGKVDAKAVPQPVLTTTLNADLFVRALMRPIATEKEPMEHNGTVNLFVRDFITQHKDKNDGEILTALIAELKDKDIIVQRVPYVGLSRDGRRYAASLVDLYFKVD